MSGCAKLPPALLDLIFARAFPLQTFPSRLAVRRAVLAFQTKRSSHAVAYQHSPVPASHLPPGFSSMDAKVALPDFVKECFPDLVDGVPPQNQATVLEQRVQDLMGVKVEADTLPDGPSYSEEELLLLYEDLLAVPPPPSGAVESITVEGDKTTLSAIAERLSYLTGGSSFSDLFQKELAQLDHSDLDSPVTKQLDSAPSHTIEAQTVDTSYSSLLGRLTGIVADMEKASTFGREIGDHQLPITPGHLTGKEWSALVRVCARERDLDAVHHVLELMKRTSTPTAETFDNALSIFAAQGNVQTTETLLQRYLMEAPTERQRDLHVEAHLQASVMTEIPTSALTVLHNYEARGLPAPQRTYTRCITHLFSARTSVAHAHAWDLFSHMRYAAHPEPDALLYTLMIRACATPSFTMGVEPERALDLFHEMTVDKGIEPTAGAYTAAILACSRSGKQEYVQEGFRLARRMLDSHRDAHGDSTFAPDIYLFKALLEGAKRIGDLGRARWLLAELVKTADNLERTGASSESNLRVDEEIMVHVFNAYTAYRPPFRRAETKILDDPVGDSSSSQNPGISEEGQSQQEQQQQQLILPVDQDDLGSMATDVVNPPRRPRFTYLPPQTRSELVSEVRLLMKQLVEQYQSGDESKGKFRHVRLTPRLLNAYLSIHYAHSSPDVWMELYKTTFLQLGVPRDARTYVEALERCARSGKDQRKVVLPLANKIWEDWERAEEGWRKGERYSLSMGARIVERAHKAMIRMLCITGQVDRALEHVKLFVGRYPPTAVRILAPRHTYRSTRTVLDGARPLVRLTSALDIPDDHVPPCLTFQEVEILHHKLVATKNTRGIKYLKWVCKSYEGSLKLRRELALQHQKLGVDAD